jgi:hypothetical protein
MDSENKTLFENRLVCFIDILGFTEIIEKFEKTKDTSIIETIKSAFDKAIQNLENPISDKSAEILNVSEEKINHLKNDIFFKTFSDNIIISFTYDDSNFLARLQLLVTFSNIFQYSLTVQGVYTRGGISFGSFYSDKNIIFSNALVKAYNLESKTAIYPRIVIDKTIIEKIEKYDTQNLITYGLTELIYFDWENVAFINPLSISDTFAKEAENMFNNAEFLNDERIKEQLESVPEASRSVALKPYTALLQEYEEIISKVKIKSTDQNSSDNVRNKYLWLIEFYKWKHLNEPTMLQFKKLRP